MSEYVGSFDVWITQQKMPIRVKAFCKYVDDEQCVILNEDLSDERKMEAVEHEVLHFRRNDLFSDLGVSDIEDGLKG